MAITGFAREEEAVKAVNAGVQAYVRKPFVWSDLWRTIQDKVAIGRLDRTVRRFQATLAEIAGFLRDVERLDAPALSQRMLQKILEVAVLSTKAEGGWLFLADPQGNLEPGQWLGFPAPGPEDRQGLFQEVFRNQLEQCYHLTGQEEVGSLSAFERDKGALMAVPLTAESACLGVMEVARPAGADGFSPDQFSLLTQLAVLGAATVEAHHREMVASDLLVRALRRAVEQRSQAENLPLQDIDSTFHDLSVQARCLDSEADADPVTGLVDRLHRLRSRGQDHLRFWEDTLDRYLQMVQAGEAL